MLWPGPATTTRAPFAGEDELVELYAAFAQGRPAELSLLTIQYGDDTHWQRDWFAGADYARQLWPDANAGRLGGAISPSEENQNPAL